jgi:phage shock protein PspC (stress-responsive transcriptional regulator)
MPLRDPFPGNPAPLTTRPEGLLSMLGIQTNGSYPQHMPEGQLQPGIDLLNWYLESRAEVQNVAPAIAGMTNGGFVSAFQVPPQEVWVLLAVTLVFTVAVGGVSAFSIVRTRPNDFRSKLALGPAVTSTAADLPMVSMDPSFRGLVLRPTVHLGLYVSGAGTAGTTAGELTCRFARCQI